MTGGPDRLFYIAEAGPTMNVNRAYPNLGSRVTIFSPEGKLVAHVGGPRPGHGPGQFISPHGIAVDSHGDIYVAEVSRTAWPQYFPGQPMPDPLKSLHKLCRI
jgi:hypothetical protein